MSLARATDHGPCDICGCSVVSKNPHSQRHNICPTCGNKCLSTYQRDRNDTARNFEPQRIVETPSPLNTSPSVLAASSRDQIPPRREPEGRAWNDIRNNARFNKARQEVDPQMRGLAPFRSAVYDLETTDLNGQIGRILCGVILVFDPEELYVFRADNYEAWNRGQRSDDREITGDILAVLECCDVHYAHNGRWFDQKFLATRAVAHQFKPVQPQKLVDPCQKARQQFALASNSLESVADHFQIPMKKTPFESNIWAKAMLDGDPSAMQYIVEHCITDVYVLAHVSRRISPWVKQIDMIGSFR